MIASHLSFPSPSPSLQPIFSIIFAPRPPVKGELALSWDKNFSLMKTKCVLAPQNWASWSPCWNRGQVLADWLQSQDLRFLNSSSNRFWLVSILCKRSLYSSWRFCWNRNLWRIFRRASLSSLAHALKRYWRKCFSIVHEKITIYQELFCQMNNAFNEYSSFVNMKILCF